MLNELSENRDKHIKEKDLDITIIKKIEVIIIEHKEYIKAIKHIASGARTDLDLIFLLLLRDLADLITDRGAVLALVVVKDLLHLQKTLAAVLVLVPLLVLLVAGVHDLGCSTGELWHRDLLGRRLLLSQILLLLLLLCIATISSTTTTA